MMRKQKITASNYEKNVWAYTEVYIHKNKHVGFQTNTNALLWQTYRIWLSWSAARANHDICVTHTKPDDLKEVNSLSSMFYIHFLGTLFLKILWKKRELKVLARLHLVSYGFWATPV